MSMQHAWIQYISLNIYYKLLLNTCNDGNTARCFFENADISSSITGVDVVIMKRFRTILKTMASGYTINLKLFEEYSLKT
ncbi:Hypothetical protein CINCED_3A004951, partial [Cinara cedri]